MQHAIAPALLGDNAHIAEVNAKLRARRDLLVEKLNAVPGWSLVPPRGAFYAFPRFELGALEDTTLVRDMITEHGVVLVHGSGFGQKEGTQHVRIVFLPQDELIASACERIAAYSAGRA